MNNLRPSLLFKADCRWIHRSVVYSVKEKRNEIVLIIAVDLEAMIYRPVQISAGIDFSAVCCGLDSFPHRLRWVAHYGWPEVIEMFGGIEF